MTARTTLFFVHGLGCSARLWRRVITRLDDSVDCVALDLPGHGDNAASDRLTVEEMVEHLLEQVLAHRPRRWALVGHSMGGKVAAIATARAERHVVAGLTPPDALVLVSASPLSAEPMPDDVRARMIEWCANGPVSSEHAREFIDANIAAPLPDDIADTAVADVSATSRDAWLAWLERGSREDWRADTDHIYTPTLVTAGAEDGPLGPAAQRDLVLPRVDAGPLAVISGAAHLAPIEQPDTLASLIRDHLEAAAARFEQLPEGVAELLTSDRVSTKTRATLLGRLQPPPPARVLDDDQRALLTALLARVVPQRDTDIDLTARLDAQLASRSSDGWRFADLPSDADAWRRGLDTLASVAGDFASATAAEQDSRIEAMIAGRVGSDDPRLLTAHQMTLWFEDVRAEAVRCWLSHPAAQAAIGYDGFANGGDGARLQGYQRIGMNEHDPWQQPLRNGDTAVRA